MKTKAEVIELCSQYIDILWQIEQTKDYSSDGLYMPSNSKRSNLHEDIANAIGISKEATEKVAWNLDKYIGIDLSKDLSNSNLKYYAEKMYDELLKLKEE